MSEAQILLLSAAAVAITRIGLDKLQPHPVNATSIVEDAMLERQFQYNQALIAVLWSLDATHSA